MRQIWLLGVLAGCSWQHTLVPDRPRSSATSEIRVSVDEVHASALSDEVTLKLNVASTAPGMAFDGRAVKLAVGDTVTQAAPIEDIAQGHTLSTGLVASAINAIHAAYANRRIRCESTPQCEVSVRFVVAPELLRTPIDMHVVLDDAVSSSGVPVAVAPIELTSQAHGGLHSVSTLHRAMGMHIGGGLLIQRDGFGVEPSGALEVWGGPQWGHTSVVAVIAFPAPMMLGVDLRHAIERGPWNLVPFLGYGWYQVLSEDYGAEGGIPQGHGARLGLEVNYRKAPWQLLGASPRDMAMGGYVYAAASRMQAGPTFTLNAGFSFGIF